MNPAMLGPGPNADSFFQRSGGFRLKGGVLQSLGVMAAPAAGLAMQDEPAAPCSPSWFAPSPCHDADVVNANHLRSMTDPSARSNPLDPASDEVAMGAQTQDDAPLEPDVASSSGDSLAEDADAAWLDTARIAQRAAAAEKLWAGAAALNERLLPLVERMRSGGDLGESAFALLYQLCVDRVYALARRFSRDAAVVEEVVEDVFVQAWRDVAFFDPRRGTVVSWLLVIARSRMLDRLRREQHSPLRFDHDVTALAEGEQLHGASQSAEAHDPIELLDALDRRHWVGLALEQLPNHARQLVALAFLRGLTHQEIADSTGLPLGTVKTTIRRALIEMRGFLQVAAPELAQGFAWATVDGAPMGAAEAGSEGEPR